MRRDAPTRPADAARSRRASTRSSSSAPARARSRSLLPGPARDRARRHLQRPGSRRHVPAVAVLPAPPVVDEAVRAGRAHVARVRALGLEQPPRPRAGAAGHRGGVHGRLVGLPVAARDGGEPHGLRRPRRGRGPLRLPLGVDAARGDRRRRPIRPHDVRRGVPLPLPDLRRRRRRAVQPVARRASSSRCTTPTPATPSRMRASACSSSASRTPGFELATGLLQWASRIALSSPSPAKTSIETRSLVGVRARYVQPFEDSILGGGVDILVGEHEGHQPGRRRARSIVQLERSDNAMPMTRRGRRGHRRDRVHLPAARPAGARRRDVRPGEAARPDGVLGERVGARGSISPGRSPRAPRASRSTASRQLRRPPGLPLQRPRARPRARAAPLRDRARAPPLDVGDLRDHLLAEATRAPELWHQKAYLASVVTLDPDEGVRDVGILPLTHFLDQRARTPSR